MVRLLVALALAFEIYGTSGALKTVIVHLAHHTFTNQTVNVTAGDVVQFVSLNPESPFRVIQAAFSAPCRPMQNGFDSGVNLYQAPYGFGVTDLNPIWFYQDGVCSKGMVGAINAPTTGDTFAQFLAAALVSRESDEPSSLSSSSGPSPSPSRPITTDASPLTASLTLSMKSTSRDHIKESPGTGTSVSKFAPSGITSRTATILGSTIGTVVLCLVLATIAFVRRRRRLQGARIAPIPPPSSSLRVGKRTPASEAELPRNETEDFRAELAQLRELVVTQLAPPPPQYTARNSAAQAD